MGILNFGSLNIDYVYAVPHIVRPGETLAASSYTIHCGGKGLNQSIALARAGLPPCHAGAVGGNGQPLLDILQRDHVDIRHIAMLSDISSGHAIIQVNKKGENSILLFGGANYEITSDMIHSVLSHFSEGDWLILQNEISGIEEIAHTAAHMGMRIIWNPSPVRPNMLSAIPQAALHMIILNEVEAESICREVVPDHQLRALRKIFPSTEIVLTLGSSGSFVSTHEMDTPIHQPAIPATAIDTTAAGDTYLGYYVAMRYQGKDPATAARIASIAAAKAVETAGAAPSIPHISELFTGVS